MNHLRQAAIAQVEPFRRLADAIPHVVWITLLEPEQVIYVSPSFEQIWGHTAQELYDDPRIWVRGIHPDDQAHVEATFVQWITGTNRQCQKLEYRVVQPSGALRWVTDHGVVVFDDHGKAVRVSGVVTDVTELKLAEREHLSHLWFLESLDKVNKAIQGTNDLEQMLDDALAQVLQIFDCDRAWLVFPSPDVKGPWQLIREQTQPAYAQANVFDHHSRSPAASALFVAASAAYDVLELGPGGSARVPAELSSRFQVESILCGALRPKVGTSSVFGLHQCRATRCWSAEEQQLFREIGRRLSDAISTLWTLRSLRESEALLEAAQRQAHLGYWNLDLASDLVTWSAETYRIFGLAPRQEPLSVRELESLVHPADRQKVSSGVEQALNEKGRYVAEYRVVRPSSAIRYVYSDGLVVKDAQGRPIGMFGTLQDITERKRAEQLLTVQHAVAKLLAEASSAEEALPRIVGAICEALTWDLGVWWRPDHEHLALRCEAVWVAPGVEVPRFLEETRAGMPLMDSGVPGRVFQTARPCFVSDLAQEPSTARAALARSEGLLATFAFPVLMGAETWGVLECFSREMREGDQDLLVTMATLGSQIGQFVERRRAESALHRARDQLAHVTRVASLGEMTASIAHEVNQPLTGIIANAHAALRWLSRQPPDVPEATEALQRLARDGKRAGEVVGRLRSLIRQGERTRKGSVDVNQVVRETLPLVRSEVQQNEVTIVLELSPELPPVFADHVQLQQVALNLIINALEAMSGVHGRARELRIESKRGEANDIAVAVVDTGVGMHPEQQGLIFDAFFTTKEQGMGMGLAISRSIVEDHGGRFVVSSAPGRGSRFQFNLPAETHEG